MLAVCIELWSSDKFGKFTFWCITIKGRNYHNNPRTGNENGGDNARRCNIKIMGKGDENRLVRTNINDKNTR